MKYQSVLAAILILSTLKSFTENKDVPQNESSNLEIIKPEKLPHSPTFIAPVKTEIFTLQFCNLILDTAPQEILDKISIIRNPLCPQRVKPKRLLLYGPSGSGKTTLAQVFAGSIGKPYIVINAGLLGNEYINSVSANLRSAIEPYLNQSCVIIIDEIDYIIKQSENEKDPEQKIPKQIWEILDMCSYYDNIFLIGITNEVNGMPEPLQTRFAGDTVEIPLNTSPEIRKKIILFHLLETAFDCDDAYLYSLAKKTKSLSNRELEKMVHIAISRSYLRGFPHIVETDDFEHAFKQITQSRSILKQWSWKDYEKPLQYTLQIASLFVNVASLIMSTKNAWDSMKLQQKGMDQTAEQANKALAANIAIANRADDRTVEAHKFQKMNLVLPFYANREWLPHKQVTSSFMDTVTGSVQFSNSEYENGAFKIFNEGLDELKHYHEAPHNKSSSK